MKTKRTITISSTTRDALEQLDVALRQCYLETEDCQICQTEATLISKISRARTKILQARLDIRAVLYSYPVVDPD